MLNQKKKLLTVALVSTFALFPNSSVISLAPASAASLVLVSEAVQATDIKPHPLNPNAGPTKQKHSTRVGAQKELTEVNSRKYRASNQQPGPTFEIGVVATYGMSQFSLGVSQSLVDVYGADIFPEEAYACYDNTGEFICDLAQQAEVNKAIADHETFVASRNYSSAIASLEGFVAGAFYNNDLAFSSSGNVGRTGSAQELFDRLLDYSTPSPSDTASTGSSSNTNSSGDGLSEVSFDF